MKTILVTGGSGFIGSHTCIELIQEGFNVIAIDSLINSSRRSIESIKQVIKLYAKKNKNKFVFYQGDVRDERFLREVFSKSISSNKIDAVIHFAGLKSINESINLPIKYWDFNVYGSINLLKIMEEFDCRTFIFSSSANIYEKDQPNLIKESDLINPEDPYGRTKFTVENLLQDIFKNPLSNWQIANLRYFNPIGAHESGLIGEFYSENTSNIFPIICEVAAGKRKYLEIYGSDYPTKDGTCIRDFIHIMDLTKGHLAALNYISKAKSEFISVNLGRGKGVSVLELVKTFQEENKCKIPTKFVERRVGDKPIVVADNSLALNIFNWIPKKNIQKMCSDGWKWKGFCESRI
jgi:UDP-glucose 4-epimerase